jgi:hypothetical protein
MHPNAILHEAQQLYSVSDRLDSLAGHDLTDLLYQARVYITARGCETRFRSSAGVQAAGAGGL